MNICKKFYRYLLTYITILIEYFSNNLKFTRFGPKRYTSNKRLDGKVVIITGANTGIGKETARDLAKRGAKVIMACRDIEKAKKAINDLKQENKDSKLEIMSLDLSSLASVRKFAEDIYKQESKIDILINNAGVMMCPKSKTEDGFEMQFQVNYLGHFLLTLLLINLLKKSSNPKIINVSALLHHIAVIDFNDINLDNNYSPLLSYARSKLAQILFTSELSRRLSETKINVYCLHPGIIETELVRHRDKDSFSSKFMRFLFNPIDAELGSQTTLYCALEDKLNTESGHYYSNCRRIRYMTSNATDDVSAKRLWHLSCQMVQIDPNLRLNQ
jgi:retinol dehydrogenase-12